ncbi:MAG TPA: hypothetical protein VFG04_09165 [Planctomycetaceae bacterium]|jgi:hypothetical protein|nr:hypothetical protein [Planctomycetaceae bacterium]
MDNSDAAIRRLLVGVLALALLTAAVLLWIFQSNSTSQATTLWRAGCGRMGVVVAALWLAMPTRSRPAAWANLNPRSVAALGLAGLAMKFPPKYLLLLGVILVVAGLVLRPRRRMRPPRSSEIEPREAGVD